MAPELLPLLAEPARTAIQVGGANGACAGCAVPCRVALVGASNLHSQPHPPRSLSSPLQGLGILARRQQPQHVLAFLQTLAPVAAAAAVVGAQALGEMRQAAESVQARWEQRQAELEAAEVAAAAGT